MVNHLKKNTIWGICLIFFQPPKSRKSKTSKQLRLVGRGDLTTINSTFTMWDEPPIVHLSIHAIWPRHSKQIRATSATLIYKTILMKLKVILQVGEVQNGTWPKKRTQKKTQKKNTTKKKYLLKKTPKKKHPSHSSISPWTLWATGRFVAS